MADFWHESAVFDFDSYWLWIYRRDLILRLLSHFPAQYSMCFCTQAPPCAFIVLHGLFMLGRREGGEVVTNPLKVCIFKPRRPPTCMWGGWGGIFHAVIVLLHDADINIQSFHIRVFYIKQFRVIKIVLCI